MSVGWGRWIYSWGYFKEEEYPTCRGASYSHRIQEEKTALVDTVWRPFAAEYVEKEIDLEKIDDIIVNHGEYDHSGALPELMRHFPDTPRGCATGAPSWPLCRHSMGGFQ